MTKAEQIREALAGRPVLGPVSLWLTSWGGRPPSESEITYPTLTTSEMLWLFLADGRTVEAPICFAHDMKVLGFKKRVTEMGGRRRHAYRMAEAPALTILKMHRQNPMPKDFRPKYDIRLALKLYGPVKDNIWSPW